MIGTIVVVNFLIIGNRTPKCYKWPCLQNHLQRTRQAWNNDPTVHPTTHSTPTIQLTNHNLLTLHGITAHPLLMRIANQISARFRLSPSQHIHVQWFFSYVFHPPAPRVLPHRLLSVSSPFRLQLLALSAPSQSLTGPKAVSLLRTTSRTRSPQL
jgi:hypothetical protein